MTRPSFHTVFFDIDDTLYDQAQPFAYAVHAVYGSLPGVTDDALFRSSRRHSAAVFAALSSGHMPSDEVYSRRMVETLSDFGVTISPEVGHQMQQIYARSSGQAMALTATMRRCLALCHKRGQVGVITNGSHERQMGKLKLLGALQWIDRDAIFISDELGIAKPGAAIFRHACATVGTLPAHCLFVGDSYGNDVRGACGVGMPVVWFNRRQRTRPGSGPKPTWEVATDEQLFALLRQVR